MGMMDAERKARIFVTDVRNTDTPVLFKHSAVWSLKKTKTHWLYVYLMDSVACTFGDHTRISDMLLQWS